jgi:hypothetical protein
VNPSIISSAISHEDIVMYGRPPLGKGFFGVLTN